MQAPAVFIFWVGVPVQGGGMMFQAIHCIEMDYEAKLAWATAAGMRFKQN